MAMERGRRKLRREKAMEGKSHGGPEAATSA